MTFKGKPVDAKAIGKDLGVRYVLEGSVQPSGDRMRVNAQLIDAEQRRSSLGRTIRHAPRRSVADAGRDRRASGEHNRPFSSPRPRPPVVKRTPAANRDAEDLALQCAGGQWKAGSIGKEADAAFALCEQALAIDPNNVRALMALGVKFLAPAAAGVSSDPKGDLERADELASKALALDPDWTWIHAIEGRHPSRPGAHRGSRRRARARARPGPVQRERRQPAWASTTERSGNSTKALNISTRRFGRARTIRCSSICTAARRGPISG